MAAEGRLDSTAGLAATPSASGVSNDSDTTNGDKWWLPQPHPSLDEEHGEWRPSPPMAEALQCSVCKDLLKEAITAAECGHSYCYDCIDQCILVGGKANFCPVCKNLLGPNPWEHHKLKYDFMLDSLVRKVFPRPKLDAALEARRLEREEATRQAKASLAKRPTKTGFARVPSSGQLAGSGRSKAAAGSAGAVLQGDARGIEVRMFPWPVAQGDSRRLLELQPLAKPYLRVPSTVTLAVLKGFLADRLVGKKGEASRLPPILFICAGQTLADELLTVQDVHDKIWQPFCSQQQKAPLEQEMLLYYAAQG